MALTWSRYLHHRSQGLRVSFCGWKKNSLPILHLQSKPYGTHILFEKSKRGQNEESKKPSVGQSLKHVVKNFGPELKLLYKEQKAALARSPMTSLEHGNYEVLYKFNDVASVANWTCSTDSDRKRGNSSAQFTLSKNRTGLFQGYLNKTVPKDGVTKYTGYANISSPRCMKSFYRETHMDWSLFNCILLRLRGDGRPYNIVVGCEFHFDVNWLNRWTFPVFTRGGPYWQVAKIPLSKLITSHSGRIQDNQEILQSDMVNSVGITVMDPAEGPFCLEIDSIALMYDINLSNVHAYELYQNKWYEAQS